MKLSDFLKVNLFLEAEDGNGDNGAGETPAVETPEPQQETPWSLKAEDYTNIKDEAESFISEAKNLGYTEAEAKKALENRDRYISSEREKMSADLKAFDENITNFINSATEEEQQVYARLAENAIGRKILIEKIMGGSATPSISGAGTTPSSSGTFTHETFIAAYNEAKDLNDKAALKRLKIFADNSADSFYRDFL